MDQPGSGNIRFEELQLLILNIAGVRFGVDMEQISEIIELEQANQKEFNIVKFDENLSFRGLAVTYKSPKVLLLKDEFSSAILVEQPEDMVSISIDSVQPLPPLLACQKAFPIWGATLLDDEVVLLVDCYRLVASEPVATVE